MGRVWRTEQRVEEECGQDKGEITWRDFFALSENIDNMLGVIVSPWLFLVFLHVSLCRPLYVFKAVGGVIHSLWCACTPAHRFSCTASSTEESPVSIYCISAVKYKTFCYNHCIISCGDIFRTPMRIVNAFVCFHVLSLIYQWLFVNRKQRDIFGNKQFFVPCFRMLLFSVSNSLECFNKLW